MEPSPFERHTSYQIITTAKALGHVFEQRLHRLGVNKSQAHVLLALASREAGAMACDLVDCVHVEPATMTRLLQGLEHQGLVRRSPHPKDGRASLVHLTDRGRELEATVRELTSQLDRELVAGLSPADLGEFRRVLAALRARAEQHVWQPALTT
ncbi:MAG: MarR family transcriptional regulator [Chloroflexi bacterium]|nr:MarR family transcriptional regulator [Chloroflexota bacterium]